MLLSKGRNLSAADSNIRLLRLVGIGVIKLIILNRPKLQIQLYSAPKLSVFPYPNLAGIIGIIGISLPNGNYRRRQKKLDPYCSEQFHDDVWCVPKAVRLPVV